jgi:hypothetical protein
MGVQALLLLPHVVAPAPVRALVFFAIGLIQGKGKGAMSEEGWIKEKEAPSVGSHALSNVVERHISTCEGDGKGECWGCSKPICDVSVLRQRDRSCVYPLSDHYAPGLQASPICSDAAYHGSRRQLLCCLHAMLSHAALRGPSASVSHMALRGPRSATP